MEVVFKGESMKEIAEQVLRTDWQAIITSGGQGSVGTPSTPPTNDRAARIAQLIANLTADCLNVLRAQASGKTGSDLEKRLGGRERFRALQGNIAKAMKRYGFRYKDLVVVSYGNGKAAGTEYELTPDFGPRSKPPNAGQTVSRRRQPEQNPPTSR